MDRWDKFAAKEGGLTRWPPVAAELKDIVRATLLCSDPFQLVVCLAVLEQHFEPVRVANRFFRGEARVLEREHELACASVGRCSGGHRGGAAASSGFVQSGQDVPQAVRRGSCEGGTGAGGFGAAEVRYRGWSSEFAPRIRADLTAHPAPLHHL